MHVPQEIAIVYPIWMAGIAFNPDGKLLIRERWWFHVTTGYMPPHEAATLLVSGEHGGWCRVYPYCTEYGEISPIIDMTTGVLPHHMLHPNLIPNEISRQARLNPSGWRTHWNRMLPWLSGYWNPWEWSVGPWDMIYVDEYTLALHTIASRQDQSVVRDLNDRPGFDIEPFLPQCSWWVYGGGLQLYDTAAVWQYALSRTPADPPPQNYDGDAILLRYIYASGAAFRTEYRLGYHCFVH